ncbi:MAG: hypothetical protein H6619_05280, partial [Deltaproteobacteria bacterium]|nr:hypothetical protein [Deltaproteobacteria bacterium]
ADIEEYRTKLRSAFSSVTSYSDFQDWFPVRFTSYDALHPTWQGARLHALDLALRLDDNQRVKLDLEQLLEAYLKSGAQDLEEYQANVGRINQVTSSTSMRRYDIFELKQAQDLLSRVSSSQLGSGLEQRYLIELYLRLRLWSEGKFKFSKHPLYPEIWEKAVKEEQSIALNKVEAFKLAVTELLHTKSSNLIIPDLSEMKPTKSWKISDTPFTVFRYTLGTEQIIDKLVFFEREIAYRVYQGSDLKFHFMKTDLLGDGSFILINTESDRWYFPIWTYTTEPTVDWGI